MFADLFQYWLDQTANPLDLAGQIAILGMFAIAFGLIGWSLRASFVVSNDDLQHPWGDWPAEQGEFRSKHGEEL